MLATKNVSHLVQCRRDITHQRHEKERCLQHGVLYEAETLHDFVAPVRFSYIHEEGRTPEEDPDEDDLCGHELSAGHY